MTTASRPDARFRVECDDATFTEDSSTARRTGRTLAHRARKEAHRRPAVARSAQALRNRGPRRHQPGQGAVGRKVRERWGSNPVLIPHIECRMPRLAGIPQRIGQKRLVPAFGDMRVDKPGVEQVGLWTDERAEAVELGERSILAAAGSRRERPRLRPTGVSEFEPAHLTEIRHAPKGTPLIFEALNCLGRTEPPGLNAEQPFVSHHIPYDRPAGAQQLTYCLCSRANHIGFVWRSAKIASRHPRHLT